jgi:membrane protein required for colicin V production
MHELNLNITDWSMIGITSLSILLGVIRGFAKEAMSLITWITAISLSTIYTEKVSLWFSSISMVGARLMLAFVLIVLATLIIGGIISHLIGKLISSAKFNLPDRLMGSLFGGARGVLIVAVFILFAGPTPLAEHPFWKDSHLIPKFIPLTHWLNEKMPADLVEFKQKVQPIPNKAKTHLQVGGQTDS